MSPGGIPSKQNSVDTEFHQHRIPSTWSSVATEFRWQWNSVDTEFARRHGITLLTRNSPVNMEFSVDTEFPCRHGIPSTRNSVDMEFRRHGILSTRNSAYFFTSLYSVCYVMLFIFVPTLTEFLIQKYTEFRGIPRNFADFKSRSLQ
jgi:hypothetical protein